MGAIRGIRVTKKQGEADQACVLAALAGDRAQIQSLVETLAPVIHARVARVLVGFGASRRSRDIRFDVEDLTQDVFAALFADNGRILKTWSPERGLSLKNFAGMVAHRHAISMLRSSKRQSWREAPSLDAELEALLEGMSDPNSETPETTVSSRETLRGVVEQLRERLSPRGYELFWLLIVEQRAPAELSEQTGLSVDALYMWRSRLLRSAKEAAQRNALGFGSEKRKAIESR
ncbi:MAG: sigma-70 family RNA polymerase sigma factor [Myxococcota bacterium]